MLFLSSPDDSFLKSVFITFNYMWLPYFVAFAKFEKVRMRELRPEKQGIGTKADGNENGEIHCD